MSILRGRMLPNNCEKGIVFLEAGCESLMYRYVYIPRSRMRQPSKHKVNILRSRMRVHISRFDNIPRSRMRHHSKQDKSSQQDRHATQQPAMRSIHTRSGQQTAQRHAARVTKPEYVRTETATTDATHTFTHNSTPHASK